jgi:2,7-dihydroxy-5-methyl-1-naphthoate 7-O-methyltransferase
MEIAGLDHLVLTVADEDATVAFYEHLGMRREEFDDGRIALRFGAQKINLHRAGAEIEPHARRATPGSADVCLLVDGSLEDAERELKDAGIAVELGPVERSGAQGPLRSLYLRDPDGNLVELSQPLSERPAKLWQLSDLSTPWCVHVAATLRIADHVAAGTTTTEELASAAGCDRDALRAVLRHLVGKGVFREPAPDRFALNEAARGLLDPALQLGLDLDGVGGRMAYAWGTLPSYVRTGAPAYHDVFGLPFWDDLAAHPEIGKRFDELMGPAGHGTPDPEFELAGGWESVRTAVDVGGGTGAMLAELLRARPGIRGTLVELPGTVERSRQTFAGVSDRATAVGQSFFDPLPAGADLYMLRKVINDWPDREATAILRRCADAARPDGRVVVVGSASAEDQPAGVTIEMVLLGGKQRSVAELRDVARAAGLELVASGRQRSGHPVVEFRPR